MNVAYDRHVESFQYKIQQRVNLANDEISRLLSDLSLLKGQIVEVTDQIHRIDRQLMQSSQEYIGRNRRQQASLDTYISSLRKNHCLKLQEIQERHSQDLLSLQKEYQHSLDCIQKKSKSQIEKKNSKYDELIQNEKNILKQMELELTQIRNYTNYAKSAPPREVISNHDEQIKRQKQLQRTILKRNQERLDAMNEGKARLADCIATLDDMESNHASEIENYKIKLEALDQRYQAKIVREKENHRREVDAIKKRIEANNYRSNNLQKTIDKVQKHHKMQIKTALEEGEVFQQMSTGTNRSSKSNATNGIYEFQGKYASYTSDGKSVDDLMNHLNHLKKILEEKENELMKERTDNESLKRELGRLKHEERMEKRRQSWMNASGSI